MALHTQKDGLQADGIKSFPQSPQSGKVYQSLLSHAKESPGHVFLVIDPPDHQPEQVKALAQAADRAGISAFAVGGSLGAQGKLLDECITAIKSVSQKPVILFPGNIATISPQADALYFMVLFNSLDPYYLSGAQVAAAYPVSRMRLETIGTAYLVFEPGQAVGWVGSAKLLPRNIPYLGAVNALAAQMMGFQLIILESGSGAPACVPPECIAAVRKMVYLPVVVAGGVRTPDDVYACITAGADIVHVGTSIVKASEGSLEKAEQLMNELVIAAKKAGKER
ncbi:MAG: geranylgeranylglyceryl/heptaprenylglyceryl phosphate synthase [Candidatus Diapherotrites archaeon]|nr:geranylgeranylglyceryl/heptaprenylglyceryl phosphate synthase [Candidatus Diapherotrites archaeon]MDZ4256682.1 geranylgeranylglyceryl/heptaprenylglyceryl phosphate synthase [archaeon]